MNKITISKLQLEAFIGIYDYEKVKKQPVELDIFLTTDFNQAALSDNITDALNYEKLIHQIIIWTDKTKFDLIETLATHLAQKLVQYFPIQHLHLRLKKFPQNLPIEYVAVEVEHPIFQLEQ